MDELTTRMPDINFYAVVVVNRDIKGKVSQTLIIRDFSEERMRSRLAGYGEGDILIAGELVRGYLPQRFFRRRRRKGVILRPFKDILSQECRI